MRPWLALMPLSQGAMTALGELPAQGVATLLVTGRVGNHLDQDFLGLARRFDAVVTENGAVVSSRAGTKGAGRWEPDAVVLVGLVQRAALGA